MALATLLLLGISKSAQLPLAPGDIQLWLQACATALALSFAVGLLPAWRARSLKIVDALAGR
jgi:putative ABC transport system permease protein